ncbi:MAG: hypothetical protein JO041_00570 [Acidobacteria bacterium]|nr:hypothetical protein [Acidobacteriota bacterium]
MSSRSLAQPAVAGPAAISWHQVRMLAGYFAFLLLFAALAVYGYDYYWLDAASRPYSAKHALLRPSGLIGLRLGILGLLMFLVIFLYPIRKRWTWLSRQGSTRNWMDFHILLGLAAPFVIAFHASFKFQGFAGMAFWIMVAVSLSGVVGRYLYVQIPRRVTAAELSLDESNEMLARYATELAGQRTVPQGDMQRLLRMPGKEQAARMPVVIALLYMVWLDALRPFRVARLRRHSLGAAQSFYHLGGLLRTSNRELERVIAVARAQAVLAKKLLFLSRAQQVFHLWHIVHKPFSYGFAVLAVIHIGVVWALGFI